MQKTEKSWRGAQVMFHGRFAYCPDRETYYLCMLVRVVNFIFFCKEAMGGSRTLNNANSGHLEYLRQRFYILE